MLIACLCIIPAVIFHSLGLHWSNSALELNAFLERREISSSSCHVQLIVVDCFLEVFLFSLASTENLSSELGILYLHV